MAWISPEQAAALVGSTVRIAMFCTFEFREWTLRTWTGAHRIDIGGVVWESGVNGAISGLDSQVSGSSEPVSFELSGVDQGVLALAVSGSGDVAGRQVTVVARIFDDQWQPIASPLPVWHGVMSRLRIRRTEGDEPVRTVAVEAEGVWEARSRQAAGRFNDADQNSRHPGDRFFRFVSAQSRPVVWPDF